MRLNAFSSSLRLKVAGGSLLTAAVALLAAFSLFFGRGWLAEREQFREDREVSAQVIAGNLAAPLLFQDRKAAGETLISARNIPEFEAIAVFDADGRLFAESRAEVTDDGKPAAPVSHKGVRAPAADYAGGHLQVHVPVMLDGARVGEVGLTLGLSHFEDLIRDYITFTLLFLILLGGGAGLVAYWLAGRVIGPIEQLSRTMSRVRADKDFSARVETASQDELGRLTGDFNSLLEALEYNDGELHRTLDELVAARDAAEDANLAKSQFLANMSHEIRTPLNGVLGMAQVMAMEPLDAAQRERLDVITASGQSLLTLLNDLLDLAKVEAGKLELEMTEFDAERLLSLAADPFRGIAETKGVALTITLSQGAPGQWRGDPARLRQIVSNLVSNALKFTQTGFVAVDAMRNIDGDLVIEVRDSGVGVPADKVGQLFEKFSQADASTTRKYGGTGLGLSICRELAELMGGEIGCESVEGEGSVFRVRLPLERLGDSRAAPVHQPAPAPVEGEEQAVIRILAAEDNPTNQRVLQAMLAPAGVELVMVGDGAQAVAAWREGGFDLVLMDVQMPVMDGITATTIIRGEEKAVGAHRIPIIALTANAMSHQVAQYLEVGFDTHVAKPIDAATLYAALDAAMTEVEHQAAA